MTRSVISGTELMTSYLSALREGSISSSLILTIQPFKPALVKRCNCTPEQERERKSVKKSDEKGAGEEKGKQFQQ